MSRFIIAIDQGTTNTKALLVDSSGQPIFRASCPVKLYTPSSGRIEQDLLEIWQSVIEMIDRCVAQVGPSSIAGVAITNQRETAAAWYRKDGSPVANAISWQCRRSNKICSDLAQHTELIQELTGLLSTRLCRRPSGPGYFSGTQLCETKHHQVRFASEPSTVGLSISSLEAVYMQPITRMLLVPLC